MAHVNRWLKGFLIVLSVLVLVPTASQSQLAGMTIIRDTEIEGTLRNWLEPLLKAAGMGPGSVKLILVQSPQINAFVAGGANMFIFTGLIEKTENPGELIGVMAHELGHISGGHLIANRQAYERASYESILGAVIGVGAAIASGEGGAAAAVMQGTSSMAQRRFLAHTRVHESSADQAALSFMNIAGVSPQGLVTFLQKLESDELLPADQQTQYMRTHPLTRDRVEAVADKAHKSKVFDQGFPQDMLDQHARMKAKLVAFINPGRVPWVYDDRDTGMPARYARAIAAYRNNQVEPALKAMDELLAAEPQNPYFHELKGQMLVDFGRVKEAVPSYRKAVEMRPDAGLLRIALAHALMESGGGMDEAIELLQRALRDEPRSAHARRLLATAYGRSGDELQAKLNLAEEAALMGRFPQAKAQADAVLKQAPPGSRAAIQAQDIIEQAESMAAENKE